VGRQLFSPRRVHRVELELGEAGWAALRAAPRVAVPVRARVDGILREDATLRLKGSNSFRSIDEKPSLRLRLGGAHEDLLGGVRQIVLNNMIDDPAQGREVVAWSLRRSAGMTGARAAFADVSIDEQDLGLHAMLEPFDDAWLARMGDDGTGDVWEANDHADLTPAGIAALEHAAGAGDAARLRIAAAAVAGEGDFLAAVEPWIDTDALLTALAWTHLLGNMDGYPFSLDDMYLWVDSSRGQRIVLLPWGLDETWDPNWAWQWGVGRLSVGCNRDAACRAALLARLSRELRVWDDLEVASRAAAILEVSERSMEKDPRRPSAPAEVYAARAELLETLSGWSDRVRASAWPPSP
jgi:spore coat protein CotH